MANIEMQAKSSPFRKVFANRNLVLLWAGQSLSLLGDTFHMIAVPWLVLQMTGDALALGTMMAAAGIPRAIFMLVGGAFSDRYPPRRIMLWSDLIRLLLTTFMIILIFTGAIRVWMLYLFSLAFGTVSGFFSPASNAIVPQMVERDDLAPANSLMAGSAQLTMFIGPAMAGGFIALFSGGATGAASITGIGLAIVVDALSFLISIATLLAMRNPPRPSTAPVVGRESMLKEIGAGIRQMVRNPSMQAIFVLLIAGNFLFAGPFVVGVPVLANTRLAGGAAAYGLINGGYSGGNLGGTLLASFLHLKGARGRWFLGLLFVAFGAALASFAVVGSTWLAFLIMIVIGVGNGIAGIALVTYLQRVTPSEMMGRVMSVLSLASVGLVPISQALSGMLIKVSLPWMFVGAGILLALAGLWAIASRPGKNLEQAFA